MSKENTMSSKGKRWDETGNEYAWKRGMSIAEIAECMGCSEMAVKMTLHRALEKLRKTRAIQALYAELN